MSTEESKNEPFFRGLLGQPFKGNVRNVFINNLNAFDGPCELAIRKAEMPPIDQLSEEARFMIGLAMRYIAASLDGVLHVSEDDARVMYGQLAEDIGDWMDQHHLNVALFTVDTLVTIWLRRHGRLYDAHDFPAPFFASRVHNYLNIFVPPLLHGFVNEDHTNTSLGALFANRTPDVKHVYLPPRAYDIEERFASLLKMAPVLRVASHIYDECERAPWPPFKLDMHNLATPPVFRIQVDEHTWLQSDTDPFMQTQTDWLIVDMRNHVWECAERVLQRKLDSGEHAEVTWGVWFDSRTRHSGPIESQMYVPVNNEYVSLTCPLEQVSGILHVLGSMLVLITHEDVKMTPCTSDGSEARLVLPEGRSVRSLIADVLKRSA